MFCSAVVRDVARLREVIEMETRKFLVLSAFLVLPALVGCGKTEPTAQQTATGTASAAAQDPAAMASLEAKSVYKKKCLVCHGATGAGDGPGSAALDPKPRNFDEVAWQDKVTDEHISKTIVGGGAAVGLSPIMPGNPELKSKPEVVKELVAIIRGFKGK